MDDVTVCIPTIPGREEMFERALESAKAQDIPVEILTDTDRKRSGAAKTRNRLLARVRTPWIAWLDDDDELLPHHCRLLLRAARFFGADLVYPTPHIPEGRDPTAVAVNGQWVRPWGVGFGPEQENHLRFRGSFIPITHLVRTEIVREVGGFPLPGSAEWPRPNVEDWGYLIRLLDAGARFVHLDKTTWIWHIHPDPAMHTGGEPGR